MSGAGPVSVGALFRTAMHDAIADLFSTEIANGDVVLAWQTQAGAYAHDMIFVGEVGAKLQRITTNRGMDVDLELIVEVESFRAGDADADNAAFTAAMDILHRIAEHVRRAPAHGDTTLGGVVQHCELVEYSSTFADAQADAGAGRLWGVTGIFAATARLRG